MRVQGDDDVTLYLNLGAVSEDADNDQRLDSEDLPHTLQDTNGDTVVDALDLDLDNLPAHQQNSANGRIDIGEDTGWLFNSEFQSTPFGQNNDVLDSEDLNGDGVLDTVDAYFQIAIPFNDIPNEWIHGRK